jgi:alkylhydroperoxidase family enzyme
MAQGLKEEKIGRLASYKTDPSFSDRERLAVEYAELMALNHTEIDDDFFRRLRAEFSDAEIVELTMAIGQYIGFGRFLHVLEVVRPVCDL